MRDTLIIDAKNIKHRLDISGWRIAMFIFCKLCEFCDVYITLNYFSILKIFFKFYSNIIILIFFLLLLSFLEIYRLKIFFFNFLFSFFIVTFFYSRDYKYIYLKNNFIIIYIIVAAIIAILVTHYLIKITDGFNDYKSFFEGDFGGDNKKNYKTLTKYLLIFFIVFLIAIIIASLFSPKSLEIKNIISLMSSGLIGSGFIGNLVPTIFKILNPGYRSIIIMNDNGVVIRNLLKLDSSKFYFWFNNDQNSPTQVRFVGWCFGSNIKKINHHQWKISKMHYYTPNNVLEYDPFENVTNFGKSTILSFKLDEKLKKHIVNSTDSICLIYMNSTGNFYAKKLFLFDQRQKSKNIIMNIIYAINNFISLPLASKKQKLINGIKKIKLIIKNKLHK